MRNTGTERSSDFNKVAQLLSQGGRIETQAGLMRQPLPALFLTDNSEGNNTRVDCLLSFVWIESRNTILLRVKGLSAEKVGF